MKNYLFLYILVASILPVVAHSESLLQTTLPWQEYSERLKVTAMDKWTQYGAQNPVREAIDLLVTETKTQLVGWHVNDVLSDSDFFLLGRQKYPAYMKIKDYRYDFLVRVLSNSEEGPGTESCLFFSMEIIGTENESVTISITKIIPNMLPGAGNCSLSGRK